MVFGIALVAYALAQRDPPVRIPIREAAIKVRTIKAPSVSVIPRALGYGNVQPGNVWEAVAEVDTNPPAAEAARWTVPSPPFSL